MAEQRVSTRLKRAIARRAEECCEYCRSQERYALESFAAEHIMPQQRGGPSTLENLAYSCQGCNNHKHTKIHGYDPVTGEQAPLYHPRQQRWLDHFAWNEDCTLIIGLTPTGRATIGELRLNRSGVVNLRRVLSAAGKHPPP